jgi:1-acyl-sn-glycerol-3-phosphate acyltransferase
MNMLNVLKKFVPSVIDVDARGVENIPSEGSALLVGDHPNIIDGLVLAVISPRPVKILVAGELCTSRVVRRIIRNLGWIPVERHKTGQNSDAMEACLRALQNGEVVALFPEGKTNCGNGMLPFKAGAALLAHKSGAPVVPFSVKGTEELYPDGSKVFHRGKAAVCFGLAERFERNEEKICPGQVETTLQTLKDRILDLRAPLELTNVGRGLPLRLDNLAGAAAIKLLSLALLRVKW